MADNLEQLREQLRANGGNGAPSNALLTNLAPAPAPDPVSTAQGFDAGEIPDLKYNLKPYVNAEGVVPEPSRARYNKFAKRITKLGAEASELSELVNGADEKTLRENPQILESLMEQSETAEVEMRSAVADLCNGHPTKKQIDDLPTRVFMRFFVWLRSELNPEA